MGVRQHDPLEIGQGAAQRVDLVGNDQPIGVKQRVDEGEAVVFGY